MDHSHARQIITAEQIRAARALLRMEQRELAEMAGFSVPTLKRIEGSSGPLRASYENAAKLVAVLEKAGIEFIPENGGGVGVRFRERQEFRNS